VLLIEPQLNNSFYIFLPLLYYSSAIKKLATFHQLKSIISKGAQYVTLQKPFLTSKFSCLLSGTPTSKTETGITNSKSPGRIIMMGRPIRETLIRSRRQIIKTATVKLCSAKKKPIS
jgi:hypothetical protein